MFGSSTASYPIGLIWSALGPYHRGLAINASSLVMVHTRDEILTAKELATELRGEMATMRAELRAEFRTEMSALAGSIARQMYAAMLGQMVLLLGIIYFFFD